MRAYAKQHQPDSAVVALATVGLFAISLFLQHEFDTRQALLFLVGIGLGMSLLHASFGFSGSWRRLVRERRGAMVRGQLVLLALTTIAFFPLLGDVFPEIRVGPALAPVGVSVLVGAFLFGVGMQLGGGCGSGTLFTVGGGHVRMLITLTFFVIGATLGSVHLPWWLDLPNIGRISLIGELGWPLALATQLAVLAVLYVFLHRWEGRHHGHVESMREPEPTRRWHEQLLFGPWPLWWAVLALALLSLATLLLAGYPWSITFAFGLWGAKLWSALGGDVSTWSYWSQGYPAHALNSSVLADTTSVMDFGIILGALLAAALAGTFAPPGRVGLNGWVSAMLGGLLLGYGARLAFGCNIGGLLAGISSGSLHGWLWLAAGFAGSWAGVHLRILMRLDKPVEVAGQ